MIGTTKKFQDKFRIILPLVFVATGCADNQGPKLKFAQPEKEARASLKRPEKMDLSKAPNIGALARGEVKPPSVDEASNELEKQGENWLYGKGLGATTLNIAACVAFPPYILYLLGNAGAEMAGYEGLHFTDAVPEPAREEVNEAYDAVVSVPGRIVAETAGEEFRENK